ncbi:MAG: DNRLRE domain-containing protein [Verrucomicrobiia bacterium]
MLKQILVACLTFTFISGLLADSVVLNPVKDNAIYEEGDLSNGAGDHLFAGQNNNGNNRRSFLAFTFNALPTNAIVTNVVLQMTNSLSAPGSGGRNIALHRLTGDWGEGTSDALNAEGQGAAAAMGDVTWTNAFFGGALWTTPGGDFVVAPSAVALVNLEGNYSWSSVGLVNDVNFWLTNGSANFGWIVIGDESATQTAKRFDSRTSGNPPVLTIGFTTNANEVVNPILSGVTFEKLRPKTGKRRNFVASKGIKVKGRVITTNTITAGTAFLQFGASNQTAPVSLTFKDLKQKGVLVGKKFKAKGVGVGSPAGETAYDVVITVGNGFANASVTNTIGLSKIK